MHFTLTANNFLLGIKRSLLSGTRQSYEASFFPNAPDKKVSRENFTKAGDQRFSALAITIFGTSAGHVRFVLYSRHNVMLIWAMESMKHNAVSNIRSSQCSKYFHYDIAYLSPSTIMTKCHHHQSNINSEQSVVYASDFPDEMFTYGISRNIDITIIFFMP